MADWREAVVARSKPLSAKVTKIEVPSAVPSTKSRDEERTLAAWFGDRSIAGTIEARSCESRAAMAVVDHMNIEACRFVVLVAVRVDRPCRTAVAGSCRSTRAGCMDVRASETAGL